MMYIYAIKNYLMFQLLNLYHIAVSLKQKLAIFAQGRNDR